MLKGYFSSISVVLILVVMALTASTTSGQGWAVPFTVCPVCGGQIEYGQGNPDDDLFYFTCHAEIKTYCGYFINGNAFYDHRCPVKQVTATIYIHDGDNGPVIPGAQVTASDGSHGSLQGTTNSEGYVTLKGFPGRWDFTASANGYMSKDWYEGVASSTPTQHAYLTKTQQKSFAATTPHGSESSVVGKWEFQRDIRCSGHFGEDMKSITTFNEDGTISDEGDMWVQNGNTVSWGSLRSTTEGGVTHNSMSYEGTIEGDTMSGKWTTASGTYGCWKADRVG